MLREGSFNHLFCCGRLLSRYAVDMYCKIEGERLLYIENNQNLLRATEYWDLRNSVNNDTVDVDIGQLVILPSSFTGSPRYYHERIQDAMTYVREFGTPDLFITFTCNPSWPEI